MSTLTRHNDRVGQWLTLPAGATGAVGSEVFRQALLHPSITRLTLLLRRPLPPDLEPSPPSPKLTTIIHSDFLSYPSSLLDQIRGADGVLWCMGVTGAVTRSTPENGYDAVTRDYPIAAAKAFSTLKNKGEGKFVFAYLSAAAANQVEGSYWLHAAKIKGLLFVIHHWVTPDYFLWGPFRRS